MKTSLFLSALAALPSAINAFSTHDELYPRETQEDYDTAIFVRDAISFSDDYDESYELALRSLKARFNDMSDSGSILIARAPHFRSPQGGGGGGGGGRQGNVNGAQGNGAQGNGPRQPRQAFYKRVQNLFLPAVNAYHAATTDADKWVAAERVRQIAQRVWQGRSAAADNYGDNEPNHADETAGWESKTDFWKARRDGHPRPTSGSIDIIRQIAESIDQQITNGNHNNNNNNNNRGR